MIKNYKDFLKSFNTFFLIVYLISLFIFASFCDNPIFQVLIYLCVVFFLFLADRDFAKTGIETSIMVGIPVVVINPLFNQVGLTPLIQIQGLPVIGGIKITLESVVFSISLALKFITLVVIFFLFNVLVHPDKFLTLVSFVIPKSAMIMGFANRIMPNLVNQLREIGDIQKIRGVNLDSKNIVQKVKTWYPFMKIVLVSSLESSLAIAESIEVRGYGKGKRKVYYNEVIRVRDIGLMADSLILLGFFVFGLFQNWFDYRFFPKLNNPVDSVQDLIIGFLIQWLVLFPLILAWGVSMWKYLRSKT